MDSPFIVEQLDHIVFPVRDLKKSVDFYRMFGGQVSEQVGGGNTPIALGPVTRLLLHVDPDYVPLGTSGNLQHFALLLRTPGDVNEVLDYVRAHGGQPFDGPKDMGRGFVQFRVLDPDGNEIEVRVKERSAE
jgi:catechol 2,3-dioxygenase-like lactoylglutathione lyase family enzyme